MDARDIVEADIKDCVKKAMKLNILLNPRISGDFYNDRTKITSKYTRFVDENDYLSKYHEKYEQGDFFATLNDGSYFQINYEFSIQRKRAYLEKMNLCYLPPVTENGEIKNEYLRIDFKNSDDNTFFHAYAHIHIGFRNAIRIPIDEAILFSEFLRMILYFFYPEQFKLLCGCGFRMTNTRNKAQEGRLTKVKILTEEVEHYLYLKTIH